MFVFDLMDTVVVDPFYKLIPAYLGLEMPELMQVKHPTSWLEFEQGKITEEEFLTQFYDPHGGQTLTDPAEFKALFINNYRFVEGMEELLRQLKSQGEQLWVLSNYPVWFEILRTRLELDRFFDGYTLSYRCGYRKPDPHCYQALMAEVAHPAANLLLIDDRAINVLGAQAVGWQGVLFTETNTLRQHLLALSQHSEP